MPNPNHARAIRLKINPAISVLSRAKGKNSLSKAKVCLHDVHAGIKGLRGGKDEYLLSELRLEHCVPAAAFLKALVGRLRFTNLMMQRHGFKTKKFEII